ncbi:MAG: hypothetical protein HY325_00030 [Chloroflexi bacterium]|nr:hypothetical protein [Chloroflexota bacterium]
MISQELHDFCERWFEKAQGYQRQSIQDCFDKFFTLFIVYNRLYAELTLSWARTGRIKLRDRNPSLPDVKAAKEYVHSYLGTNHIWSNIQNDAQCQLAVSAIRKLLENQVFVIKLDRLRGEPRPEEDKKLLEDLRSENQHRKVGALLDIIYSVRCNMFHGHKGFDRVQIEILVPLNILLDKLTILLYERLSNDYELGMLLLGEPERVTKGGWYVKKSPTKNQ